MHAITPLLASAALALLPGSQPGSLRTDYTVADPDVDRPNASVHTGGEVKQSIPIQIHIQKCAPVSE